jgi:integrase
LSQIKSLSGPECYKEGLQTVLPMTRPTKHPKTGTYLIRMAVPAALRDTTIAAYAQQVAEQLLRENGFATADHSIKRLSIAIERAAKSFRELLRLRSEGDWSEDVNLAKFPRLPAKAITAGQPALPAPSGCTFDTLLAGWALDHGFQVDAKPIPRALYDRKRTIERLATFLGHRNADQVTKADAVRWKEDALGRGRTASTVRNDISEMTAVWAWGIRNGKLRTETNPFQGTLPPKARKKAREQRAFTDTEADLILQAARQQTGFLRWLPWVLCLTGARLNEIGQADKADVSIRDGVPVIRIHDEGDGRTVKNADSRRTVPLHPALIGEGFLDYVAKLPTGSLWPDVKPDAVFGLRSVTAGRRIARWLRADLGIEDALISPSHSWRHWFIGACRRVVMPLEVRSAITGHSAKMDESAGYGDGMGTFVQVVAGYMAKVACPVGQEGAWAVRQQ